MDHAELPEYVDVLVIGAGISGIGMGHYLRTMSPDRTFAYVDARDEIGGTWATFRYPGIRSDSDLHTFGFEFKPWPGDNWLAQAHEILGYLNEVIDSYDLRPHIYLGHRVVGASWSSEQARWTVELRRTDGHTRTMTCGFIYSGAGFYDHDKGYTPEFAGREDFRGQIVHPQHWPTDLDYAGKRVVVIGSGATAATLIPAMAHTTGHITMLQRSPGYVLPIPAKNPIARFFRAVLPGRVASKVIRSIHIMLLHRLFTISQRYPAQARALIRWINVRLLPEGYDVDTHFNPRYNPWDERLCMVPEGDLFKAISEGRASVVTDHIERFTEHGILLTSGQELKADLIVTATGMNLVWMGGIPLTVDGRDIAVEDALVYKSCMLEGVPNFAYIFGYTNTSWTLKVGIVGAHVCRILNQMASTGRRIVVPVNGDPTVTRHPIIDFRAGYVQRSLGQMSKRGSHGPWTVEMDYHADAARLRGPVEDPALRFCDPGTNLVGDLVAESAGVPA